MEVHRRAWECIIIWVLFWFLCADNGSWISRFPCDIFYGSNKSVVWVKSADLQRDWEVIVNHVNIDLRTGRSGSKSVLCPCDGMRFNFKFCLQSTYGNHGSQLTSVPSSSDVHTCLIFMPLASPSAYSILLCDCSVKPLPENSQNSYISAASPRFNEK